MASFDYRLNPLFTIKECSSCGALYTTDYCCFNVGLVDMIIRDPNLISYDETPDSPSQPQTSSLNQRHCFKNSSQRLPNCPKCGDPVEGLYCRQCALIRKKLEEVFQDFQDTLESSNHNTNVVSAPQEPFVFNQDPGVNSSQSPPQRYGIFCQQCTCKSCGNGAHIGYNCPPKAPIISNPEQCNQTINELPQTLPSVNPTCNSRDENSFTYDSKPNFADDSPNVFNPQPQYVPYSCELCGNDAHHGYDCPLQVPFVYNQDPCFNQNFDYFPQTSSSFPQQYLSCKNYGGPNETFQCQPMNEDYYEQNSCYDPNSFGFDQYQPPQFPVNYPPQETSREILRAQEDLMEAIQAFLKEYDHIPPNEKCMTLLLDEERFLKIKQTMREEHNQPEVMQELLLKLMDDLQIFKGSQQEKKETAAQSLIPCWNSSMIDDEEARDNFLKDVCIFLRKFSHIPFGVTPKVILISYKSFGEIKDALMDKQYRQEDIQELMSKLLEDVQNISEEFSEYINCPSWNRPLFYFDDDDDEYTLIWRRPKAITPDEPSKEPEVLLIMGEKELSTIPEKDKSSVEDLDPIPSGSKGVSNDICDNDHSNAESLLSQDIPITSPKIDFLSEEFADEFAPIPPGMDEDEFDEEEVDGYDHDISSDDNSYENIEYVEASPLNLEYDGLEEENEDQEEKEFDLEDIFQIHDVILREKLLNVHRLITNIEYLKNNPTPDFVFKSPSLFPISVVDSDSFFEESDTSLSHSEFESFHFDPSFLRPPPEPPDVEICLHFELDAPVIDNFNELNDDQRGSEIDFSQNVGDDDSFTFVIRTFLPFLTYPEDRPTFFEDSRVRCFVPVHSSFLSFVCN
ncbi:hypothetical protein Tco_1223698 [Tanacetum coccineum]